MFTIIMRCRCNFHDFVVHNDLISIVIMIIINQYNYIMIIRINTVVGVYINIYDFQISFLQITNLPTNK